MGLLGRYDGDGTGSLAKEEGGRVSSDFCGRLLSFNGLLGNSVVLVVFLVMIL